MAKQVTGNLVVGDIGWNQFGFYGFAHRVCANRNDFALIQSAAGQTILNGKTGIGVDIRVNNTSQLLNVSGVSTITGEIRLVTGSTNLARISSFAAGYTYFHGAMAVPSATNFALAQGTAGTILNAATGLQIYLQNNNTDVAYVQAGGLLMADAKDILFATGTGTKLGGAANQKWAAHGATPVVQRAGAAQAAVATTGAVNVAPYGFTTAAQADALVTLVNELRAALTEKGIIKGAA